MREQRMRLQHDTDVLWQTLNHELLTLNDTVRGLFDDRKMAVREEQKANAGSVCLFLSFFSLLLPCSIFRLSSFFFFISLFLYLLWSRMDISSCHVASPFRSPYTHIPVLSHVVFIAPFAVLYKPAITKTRLCRYQHFALLPLTALTNSPRNRFKKSITR